MAMSRAREKQRNRSLATSAEELQAKGRKLPGVIDLLRIYDQHLLVVQSATTFTNLTPLAVPSTSGANAQ